MKSAPTALRTPPTHILHSTAQVYVIIVIKKKLIASLPIEFHLRHKILQESVARIKELRETTNIIVYAVLAALTALIFSSC